MFEPLYTAAEMRAAEAGHDVPTLMERAGRAVAEEALRRFPDARAFGGVCGGGANGGDGRIALQFLRAAGREAHEGADGDILIDALFGTGFRGEPRPEAAALIEEVNAAGRPIVAVDLPSGVDADTGEIASLAVRADVTVTMHGRKVGLEIAPGRFHAGEVVVADIGLEPRETEHRLVTRHLLSVVPHKGERDNKYTSGAVLVVGGSPGMSGAVTLTASAAFRADAGYVTVCSDVEPQVLEAVKRPLEAVWEAIPRHASLAIGPGLGRERHRQALVRRLLEETELPTVVDADGLFGLEPFARAAPTVLTPHSGELARLLGHDSEWVDAHRLAAVREAVEEFDCVCLLKGADTIVASRLRRSWLGAPPAEPSAPGQEPARLRRSWLGAPPAEPSAPAQEPARLRRDGVLVCHLEHPSLATAGTGDVLTGVIAAFLAKGLDARLAAAAGAIACDAAAGLGPDHGLVASDVVSLLPRALGENPSDGPL